MGIVASGCETRNQKLLKNPSTENLDILSEGDYSGLPLATFANIPHVNCFRGGTESTYDMAILGAPFDTVGAHHCLTQEISSCPLRLPLIDVIIY